jgi:CheY-like chemotaxis protein/anti-sigma regulatory factor (Ser/Thr protein kinase)
MLTSLIVDAARADAKGLLLRRELIRPQRLAQALAASLAGRAEAKGLAAETNISSDLPESVIGDPLRLRAALENLIDNAVKFTKQGSVRLEVTSKQIRGGKVQLLFTVTDTGIGLTAAETKRLYRPFVQANPEVARRYGGAGLGLAFVKRVAKAMGGDLALAAEASGGSCFRFSATLDQVAPPPAGAQAAGVLAHAAPARVLDVLCVEDNPYGRILLNTILTELGHRADFVGTGVAAVDAVAHRHYDVVLLDVALPDIDGVEATRRIRALGGSPGRVPIVGVAGGPNAADEAAGRAAGMDGYLTKPLSPGAVTRALGSLAWPPEA